MTHNIFLFSPAGGQGGDSPNMLISMLPILLMFVVLYFFMIRPQRKKQKEREQLLSGVQKGDKVVTIGGAHGTVAGVDVEKNILLIQFADNVKIKMDRSAVASVEKGNEKSETADKLEA